MSKVKVISNVVPGAELYSLWQNRSADNKLMIIIASSETRFLELKSEAEFFFQDYEILTYPSYDCLPYDRVSPSNLILSERISCLVSLAKQNNEKKIVITTIAALIQKTVPKEILINNIINLKSGNILLRDQLIANLIELGYMRTEIANEAGCFSVRGSIVDIFINDSKKGYRIDFFGNEIESIKQYDAESQLSIKKIEKIEILPISEIFFNQENIEQFKRKYLDLHKVALKNDYLFEAVSSGKKIQGLEHWLPLFYNKLDNLFDYFCGNALFVTLDDIDELYNKSYKAINDYYNLRVDAIEHNKLELEGKYFPVEQDEMWLNIDELHNYFSCNNIVRFEKFSSLNSDIIKSDSMILPNFFQQSKLQKTPVAKLLLEHIKDKKLLVTIDKKNMLSKVKTIFENMGKTINDSEKWNDIVKADHSKISIAKVNLRNGFQTQNLCIVSYQELFGDDKRNAQKSNKRLENLMQEASSLVHGELVIHANHGLGKFGGVQTVTINNIAHDFILIFYEDNDKLYLPVENLELMSKYGEEEDVKLDKLGQSNWQERKARARNKIKEIAKELIQIAAQRELHNAPKLVPVKSLYDEFCTRFPHIETDDQLSAIKDVEEDFMSGKPTDRLICGDVGFGKTEVAMRAAFIATNTEDHSKCQVALVVPTTLLAKQHYDSFVKRFVGFNLRIEMISRIVPQKRIRQIKQDLSDGNVDIVIGTHALLANDVRFKNLQLLIIDEEQHFGVKQKEKLKSLQTKTHVLTLSATPIPRTMQMSLVGIRDLSLIATPPIDRIVTKTLVIKQDATIIQNAIYQEINRGGKCFFVVPRVSHIEEVTKFLRNIDQDLKIVVAHGQMRASELEEIMHKFYVGEYDILVSTTIIESGLDIPKANTIFVYKAEMFGLSALYQLRGRVGRSNISSFAYYIVKTAKLNQIAEKRLSVIKSLNSLGMGFSLASHDMDIRGAGNLVGDEQSGQIKEIGIELYQEMLKDAIASYKDNDSNDVLKDWSPLINIGFAVLIPTEYIADTQLKINLYKRISKLESQDQIIKMQDELEDRFGKVPDEVCQLLQVISLKIRCKKLNIEKIDAGEKGIVIIFRNGSFIEPEKLFNYTIQKANLKLKPEGKLVLLGKFDEIPNRINAIKGFFDDLEDLII